jgi:hypothetical protein
VRDDYFQNIVKCGGCQADRYPDCSGEDQAHSDSLKNDLKATLAEKIFDPNEGNAPLGDDEVKSILPHLTSLISALKK